MTNLEGNLDFFLDQGTALRLIYEKAEPYLWATRFVDPIQDDKDAFLYRYDSVGKDSDPKKKKPAHVRIGGDFPEINMSRPNFTSELKDSRGFSVRIKRQTIRDEPQGIDEVQRAYKAAGYWMARFLHDDILAVLKAGATTPSWSPAKTWGEVGAVPVDDLIGLEAEFDREGYAYAMSDILIHKDNFFEMKKYLTGVDITDTKQRELYGVPVVKKDTMQIPVVDSTIWKCRSGMDEGSIMALDEANPGAELHYYVDTKFSTAKVQYETIIDGKKTMVTADNVGLHFDTWVEKGSEDTIMKFWIEHKVVVTEPYAILYKSSGI